MPLDRNGVAKIICPMTYSVVHVQLYPNGLSVSFCIRLIVFLYLAELPQPHAWSL